jgi:4-hydroxy-tetrahydrodipicolinate synthase
MNFTGSMTAIVTPFNDGVVDEQALRALCEWQINEGICALVPCGTTGEAATLSMDERQRVMGIVVDAAQGKVPVIAGAGSNSTTNAIELAYLAKEAGADAQLQVCPYYNKPTQEGLYQHFKKIADETELPIILYNVPGRTAVNMTAETTLRLAELESIVGIKEASGDLDQIRAIVKGAPDDFVILSGEDAQNVEIYKLGGKGCISVTANVVPSQVTKVWKQFESGALADAEGAHEEIQKLNAAMFFETNPIPVKTTLAMMGKIKEEFRLPLTKMGEENRTKLSNVLKSYGLV